MKITGFSLVCSCSVYAFALLFTKALSGEVEDSPLGKVIELLGVLNAQIAREGRKDEAAYNAYVDYYNNEVQVTDATVKEHGDKIAQLDSDLKEAQAFRDGKSLELSDLIKTQTEASVQHTAGKQNRREERTVFESNEDKYDEALDTIRRSLKTMKKKMPADGAASASFVSIVEGLKDTLTHSSDIALSATQQHILDNFVMAIRSQTVARRPPSFLQHGSTGPYGDYEHGKQSTGVISILEGLLEKVEKERETARTTERTAQAEWKDLDGILSTKLGNVAKSMSDIKVSIAQSDEESSRKKIALMRSREIYKTQVQYRSELEDTYRRKTQAYKIRLSQRSDEVVAVHEARRMLNTDIAKRYIAQQANGTRNANANGAHNIIALQGREKAAVRRKAIHVLKRATSPGMALLALEATVHFKKGRDPFVKVKGMIKDMLKNLMLKQAKESTHAEFCDREMSKAAVGQKLKLENIEKLSIRLEALEAEISETESDISTSTRELKELQEAMAAAVKLRDTEHNQTATAKEEYKAAEKFVNDAVHVLNKYYGHEKYIKDENDGASQHTVRADGNVDEFKKRRGMGHVIISILEIAADDFHKQYIEIDAAEETDKKDFAQLLADTALRIKIFKNELERDTGTKTDLELNKANMETDLKSSEKELQNLGTYMDKLKSSCMIEATAANYEAKKLKREELLKSLNEVLAYVNA